MSKTVNTFLFVCFILIVSNSVRVEGRLRGRFIHITDTHIFHEYRKGTDPDKYCADHGTNGTAGEFGDYHCDPPPSIMNFTKEALKHREKPDFILFGGDHVAFFSANQSIEHTEKAINEISEVLREIRAAYGSDVRVFPVIGNHDSYPDFQFPQEGPYFVYEAAAKAWADFLRPESLKTIRKGGYYTELIEPGLRIMVVNTPLYFIGNLAFPKTVEDPGNQFAWMRDVLKKAKDAGEHVFVATHIPPGGSIDNVRFEMWNAYNDQYVRTFEGFNGNTVSASFYGHTHWATFRILTNENISSVQNDNSHVGFVSSSITPDQHVNPVFYEYTFQTKAPYNIIDRDYNYIDIKQANAVGHLEWSKAKSYREIFGIKTLDAESMNKAIIRMRSDTRLFRSYYQDLRTHSPYGDTECEDRGCRNVQLCAMNYTLYQTIHDCIDRYH